MTGFENLRSQFPILDCTIHGKPLIYLDSAATTLKPRQVVDRIAEHYLYETSNVHRGIHFLSDQATRHFEESREKVAQFVNAQEFSEIIFTSGTTAGINFVAGTYGNQILESGDEIIVSEMEHHSNFVPWQQLALNKNAKLNVCEINQDGSFNLENFKKLLNSRTKIVALTHISNTLGTVVPVAEVCRLAHAVGARVLIDGAQAVAHQKVDLKKLGCDFYVFSAHKVFGPTGFGVLYIKQELHENLVPYQFGGGMVDIVTAEQTTFQHSPHKFEAGTPHISGAIGLSEALGFAEEQDLDQILKFETQLTNYAQNQLRALPEVDIYGNLKEKGSIISFNIDKTHPSDVASLLDHEGIAVRSGHHCTQPLMQKWKIPGTVRISFSIYNTREEIDSFIKSLKKVITILKV